MGHTTCSTSSPTFAAQNSNMRSLIFVALLSTCVMSSPPLQIDISSSFESLGGGGPSPSLFAGVRLSQDVQPLHYDLTIQPIVHLPLDDPQQFTAPGSVVIRLQVLNPTDNITLHVNDMDVDFESVQLRIFPTSIFIRVLNHTLNPSMSTYTLILEEAMQTQLEYELRISFIAKVGDRLSGLYRSSYLDASGNTKWLATTQFQKLGARQAFPCFDEPSFKSTFNITIIRPDAYHSLTNSPLISSTPADGLPGYFTDSHETTVQMSSYLIAIIVSDFASVSSPAQLSNYDVKIWGPPTVTNNASAAFAAEYSAKIVTFFENYFQSPYQFSKLDSAAIPDFSAGAMENWALNTYRVNYLITFEDESTAVDKWNIARVLAHEISHHWFGDLVTCDWWNDIYLNEGFASFWEILGGHITGYDMDALDRYVVDKFQVAMPYDMGPNTEPVHNNETDIVNSQASTIIYQKGASLIRMMIGFLTEETFIEAIRKYLDKYAYNTTVQQNLFDELQSQADLDGSLTDYTVNQVMTSWTDQTGFPIVSVTWFPGYVLFRHEIFSLTPPHWDETATQAAGRWFTPIAWTTGSNPDFSPESSKPKLWFEPGVQNTTRTGIVTDDEWIVVNPDARSYYRIIYCSHFRSLIMSQLATDHSVFTPSSRSQIIDDLFATVWTNGWENAQVEDALDLTTYLAKEGNTAVWITVFNNLRPIKRYLSDTEYYEDFKVYLLSLITPLLDFIGWEQAGSDPPKTAILRSQLLDWACALDAPGCNLATARYASGIAVNGEVVPADIQPIIYCKGISIFEQLNLPNGFSFEDYLLEQYNRVTRAERYPIFVNSLACVAPSQLERWLNSTMENSPITQTSNFLQRVAENPTNRGAILQYFTANLPRIISALGENVIATVVSSIAGFTSSVDGITEVTAFIDAALEVVQNANVRNSLNNSRTTMTNNVGWMDEFGVRIGAWLRRQK